MKWLADFPSTNARIVVTLAMAAFSVVFVLALMAFGVDVQEGTVGIVFAYLAAQGGFDYAQFKAKRETAWAPPRTESEVQTGEPVRPESAPPPGAGSQAIMAALEAKAAGVPLSAVRPARIEPDAEEATDAR